MKKSPIFFIGTHIDLPSCSSSHLRKVENEIINVCTRCLRGDAQVLIRFIFIYLYIYLFILFIHSLPKKKKKKKKKIDSSPA